MGARVSFVLAVWGIALTTLGGKFTRQVGFPIFFLLFLVPFPESIRGLIAGDLQLFASKVSSFLLDAIGIVNVREGNILVLSNTKLEVATACSGIRSIIAYLMLSVLFGQLREFRLLGSLILVTLSIPIALAANIGRVTITGILASHDPKLAFGFLHEFSGILLFAVGFIVFVLISSFLCRFKGLTLQRAADNPPREKPIGQIPPPPMSRTLLAMIILCLTAAGTQALVNRPAVEVVNPNRLQDLDMLLGDWLGSRSFFADEAEINKILNPTTSFLRTYQRLDDQISLYVGYYETKKGGRSSHNPQSCYAGAGWLILKNETVQITPQGSDQPVVVTHFVVDLNGDRQDVFFWYQTPGRHVWTQGLRLNLLRFWRSVVENRNDGALVRVTSFFQPGDEDRAAQRVKEFSESIIPALDKYWPSEREVK